MLNFTLLHLKISNFSKNYQYFQQIILGSINLILHNNMSRSQQIGPNKQSPNPKRRGRPEKRTSDVPEDQEQLLFSIHDNIFHASILFYTFHIFDKAPTRAKFNPTIGFSIYEKVKSIPEHLRKYYDNDQIAEKQAQPFAKNYGLKRFFINSLTFGPKCVIDQFYKLFNYILEIEPTVQQIMQFLKMQNFKYIMFNCSVLDYLQVKTQPVKEKLNQVIEAELKKLMEIIQHTLLAIKAGQKQNRFAYILQTQEDMFERGVNSNPKKKVKKQK